MHTYGWGKKERGSWKVELTDFLTFGLRLTGREREDCCASAFINERSYISMTESCINLTDVIFRESKPTQQIFDLVISIDIGEISSQKFRYRPFRPR
jgi:hypothetical protein